MQALAALIAGLIFGIGLIVGGMTNPAKVQNFLDVFGTWDLSLAFVMAGAIGVTMPLYALLKRRDAPLFAPDFHWPTRTDLDGRLIGGAALFGIGWGLAGFCPGPAITSLGLFHTSTLIFVVAMLISMAVTKGVFK